MLAETDTNYYRRHKDEPHVVNVTQQQREIVPIIKVSEKERAEI